MRHEFWESGLRGHRTIEIKDRIFRRDCFVLWTEKHVPSDANSYERWDVLIGLNSDARCVDNSVEWFRIHGISSRPASKAFFAGPDSSPAIRSRARKFGQHEG